MAVAPARRSLEESARDVTVSGWGNVAPAAVRLYRAQDEEELAAAIRSLRRSALPGAIARGMGRSYGDAAQLRGGGVLELSALNGHRLDRSTGRLQTGAGATLAELLSAVMPEGWVLPVLPGTQHVSVGGAIAGDIHGKSHGVSGSFCRHVVVLRLLGADGEIHELTPEDELFWATAGGMGLTGAILEATLQLEAVGGPLMSVDTDRVGDLDAAFAALRARGGGHRVAWLDLLASSAGRGFVTRAEQLPGGRRLMLSAAPPAVRSRAEVPRWWPGGVLRPASVRAFNELRFRMTPRRQRGKVEPLSRHLFPLDALDAWPRLYGAGGLLQYQFVVPFGAEETVRQVISLLRRRRLSSYLAVLKDFGPGAPGPLSFPMPGWTLAMDFPRAAPGLDVALDACDELVAAAGGRVYLSKDVRLRAEMLAMMYPELGRFRRIRDTADPDGLWRSDLALRTGLVEPR